MADHPYRSAPDHTSWRRAVAAPRIDEPTLRGVRTEREERVPDDDPDDDAHDQSFLLTRIHETLSSIASSSNEVVLHVTKQK